MEPNSDENIETLTVTPSSLNTHTMMIQGSGTDGPQVLQVLSLKDATVLTKAMQGITDVKTEENIISDQQDRNLGKFCKITTSRCKQGKIMKVLTDYCTFLQFTHILVILLLSSELVSHDGGVSSLKLKYDLIYRKCNCRQQEAIVIFFFFNSIAPRLYWNILQVIWYIEITRTIKSKLYLLCFLIRKFSKSFMKKQ